MNYESDMIIARSIRAILMHEKTIVTCLVTLEEVHVVQCVTMVSLISLSSSPTVPQTSCGITLIACYTDVHLVLGTTFGLVTWLHLIAFTN